jgi:aminoglycoside 3-N-acetyltransferase
VFDPATTPSQTGLITNHFRQMPGVVRSLSPSHSLAARGNQATELCAGHDRCSTPCGPGTPYEKLIQRDAAVLMFGATMHTYTLFHTAEDAAACDYLYYKEPFRMRVCDHGQTRELQIHRQDMSVKRRFVAMDTVLEREHLLHRVPLGIGELLWIVSSHQTHKFLLEQLRQDPHYLLKR